MINLIVRLLSIILKVCKRHWNFFFWIGNSCDWTNLHIKSCYLYICTCWHRNLLRNNKLCELSIHLQRKSRLFYWLVQWIINCILIGPLWRCQCTLVLFLFTVIIRFYFIFKLEINFKQFLRFLHNCLLRTLHIIKFCVVRLEFITLIDYFFLAYSITASW